MIYFPQNRYFYWLLHNFWCVEENVVKIIQTEFIMNKISCCLKDYDVFPFIKNKGFIFIGIYLTTTCIPMPAVYRTVYISYWNRLIAGRLRPSLVQNVQVLCGIAFTNKTRGEIKSWKNKTKHPFIRMQPHREPT